MKYITVILCIFLCFGKAGDIQLIKATTQKWSSGKQGITGVKYQVILKTNLSSKKLTMDHLWVGNSKLDCKMFKYGGNMQDKTFEAGDTIMITAEIIHAQDTQLSDKPPYKYKSAALITYKKGKKQKYVEIDCFEKQKALIYP